MENGGLIKELLEYLVPATQEQLYQEPYREHTEKYTLHSDGLNFYRGFIKPHSTLKGKIFRAIYLSRAGPDDKGCVIFTSDHGLVVKLKSRDNSDFTSKFESYLEEPDEMIFIPQGYDRLDKHETLYYQKLLNEFRRADLWLNRSSEIIRFIGHEHNFIFLSFSEKPPFDITKLWSEFNNGGIHRTFSLTPGMVPEAARLFPWNQRVKWQYSDGSLSMTVKSLSEDEFKDRVASLVDIKGYTLIPLQRSLETEDDGIGLLRHLHSSEISPREIIPLVGTDFLVAPETLREVIQTALESLPKEQLEIEGVEVFSQTPFNELSPLTSLSLVLPSRYLFLKLVQYMTKNTNDPLTREPLEKESIQEILQQLDGTFLIGFPTLTFDPQLYTFTSGGWIYCSIYHRGESKVFWQFRDWSDEISSKVLEVLVRKWSDQSIFRGPYSGEYQDLSLVFSPLAYYLFSSEIDTPDKLEEGINLLQRS